MLSILLLLTTPSDVVIRRGGGPRRHAGADQAEPAAVDGDPAGRGRGHTILANVSRGTALVLSASAVIGGYLVWNWQYSGELAIGRNSAYNLYIGNRDMYGEDLNLLSPRATPEQIEFRRQMWSGELVYPTQSAAELQREALRWIAEHPATFVRRSVGRLARVFVPRTDVLELAGGDSVQGSSLRAAITTGAGQPAVDAACCSVDCSASA